jgi:hypothetical protein
MGPGAPAIAPLSEAGASGLKRAREPQKRVRVRKSEDWREKMKLSIKQQRIRDIMMEVVYSLDDKDRISREEFNKIIVEITCAHQRRTWKDYWDTLILMGFLTNPSRTGASLNNKKWQDSDIYKAGLSRPISDDVKTEIGENEVVKSEVNRENGNG